MKPLRILVLTRYGELGASSRLRSFQYIPSLREAGFQFELQALISNEVLLLKYQRGQYPLLITAKIFFDRISALLHRKQFELLWIEKEALPWWPLWIEASLLHGVPYVLDFDDALFHNYDQHSIKIVRHLFGRRLDRLMAKATLVVGGNDYLAQRAKNAGAPWVEVLPTVIDLSRYPYPHEANNLRSSTKPMIVWIGSPSTLRYLELLRAPLQELARRRPFVLRVIGGDFDIVGVDVESIPWSDSTEVAYIASCDVGVMPLFDSPWERGKCGYKLIQYMACGLPVVASPVGVNSSIVQEGVNGFLADTAEAWVNRLERLLSDASLRSSMGAAGRSRVEQEFCLQVTGSRLASMLRRAAGAVN